MFFVVFLRLSQMKFWDWLTSWTVPVIKFDCCINFDWLHINFSLCGEFLVVWRGLGGESLFLRKQPIEKMILNLPGGWCGPIWPVEKNGWICECESESRRKLKSPFKSGPLKNYVQDWSILTLKKDHNIKLVKFLFVNVIENRRRSFNFAP